MGFVPGAANAVDAADPADVADAARLVWHRAVRTRERLKSPLEIHKVRLRGLGGPGASGVPNTCASATGRSPGPTRDRHHSLLVADARDSATWQARAPTPPQASPRRWTSCFPSGEFIRSWWRTPRIPPRGRHLPPLRHKPVHAGGLRVFPAANSFAPGGRTRGSPPRGRHAPPLHRRPVHAGGLRVFPAANSFAGGVDFVSLLRRIHSLRGRTRGIPSRRHSRPQNARLRRRRSTSSRVSSPGTRSSE
jgi:hypothetical protein